MRIVITGPRCEVNVARDLVKRKLLVWSESRTRPSGSAATPDEVTVYLSAHIPGGTGERVVPVQRCVVCGEDVEYVPTPEGCDPVWHPPYWRHVAAQTGDPHAAIPAGAR